ncbi:RlpA-like double-psi beta-barrel-protein domain-containing protein-containing protein [Lyophyllum atratum]|nr:RlpA-like double-psi beta-barrel-protein domain-containing protein-containing protein [Lyophyllum atratum]
MSFKSLVLLFCLAASVSALSTQRNAPHHRAVAHRAAAISPALPAIRRRADGKRCRPRPSSSLAVVPTSEPAPVHTKPATTTPKDDPTPTPKPTTTPKDDPTPKPTTTPKPEPTTTPKPQPTTTPKPQPTTTPKPEPTTTKASGGGGGGPSFMIGTQTGQGTFYATGLGACGIVNRDTDYIAAASHLLFDAFPGYTSGNPNKNPMCGRKVRVQYQGKSVVVTLTDRCEGCAVTDLDFSPSAFRQLADFGVGRINQIQWVWL